MAPSNFGVFSNALLVSNNVNAGTVVAFDPNTGAFLGTVSTSAGKKIALGGIWGIEFGGGIRKTATPIRSTGLAGRRATRVGFTASSMRTSLLGETAFSLRLFN